MNRATLFTLSLTALMTASSALAANATCPAPWKCEVQGFTIPYSEAGVHQTAHVKLRVGYREHSGTFAGNILYLEGLGDSMLNHEPLFKLLGDAGYRVISYDYMGQGGSDGKMDHTRITRIGEVGNLVWNKYAKLPDPSVQKTVIGWSTGGLAAYMLAAQNKSDRVILIAPGIAPNVIVGGGLTSWPPDEITVPSLTTASEDYARGGANPHQEAIRPSSPAVVPSFALNLIATGTYSRTLTIPENVKGLVLLSGPNDTYVDAALTKRTLKGNWYTSAHASQFEIVTYPKALHEIDNESDVSRSEAQLEDAEGTITTVALDARDAILDFLKRTQN